MSIALKINCIKDNISIRQDFLKIRGHFVPEVNYFCPRKSTKTETNEKANSLKIHIVLDKG